MLDYFTIIVQICRIALYLVCQLFFIKKYKNRRDSGRFEILACLFFMFINIEAIIELISQIFFPAFYNGDIYLGYPTLYGWVLSFFFGFVAIGLLTLGTELKIKLKTRGFLSILPFLLAGLTLATGKIIVNYIYFLGMVIIIVPLVYFYIAFKAEKDIRKRSFIVAFGYLILLIGEANNYNLVQYVYPLNELTYFLEGIIGFKIAFLSPLVAIFGLILLVIGYKMFAFKE